MSKLRNVLQKIKNVGKPKEDIPVDWEVEKKVDEVKTVTVRFDRSKRYFRIPFFRGFKRFLAFILFLVNIVTGFFSLEVGFMSILFFVESFLLLDYMWKTRIKNEQKNITIIRVNSLNVELYILLTCVKGVVCLRRRKRPKGYLVWSIARNGKKFKQGRQLGKAKKTKTEINKLAKRYEKDGYAVSIQPTLKEIKGQGFGLL